MLVVLLVGCTAEVQDSPSDDRIEASPVEEEVVEELVEEEQPEESASDAVQPDEEKIEEREEEKAKPQEEIQESVLAEETVPEVKKAPLTINGKTLEQRLDDAYDNLHESGSSKKIEKDFPDVELVYTDNGENTPFPSEILPFHYYYSEEADKTFNLCGVGRSVFICDGKLERVLSREDIDSGRCEVTEEYDMDPRLK